MSGAQSAARSPIATEDFVRRAAIVWIRAADAGLVDAGELAWLLDHLPDAPESARAAAEPGAIG